MVISVSSDVGGRARSDELVLDEVLGQAHAGVSLVGDEHAVGARRALGRGQHLRACAAAPTVAGSMPRSVRSTVSTGFLRAAMIPANAG